MSYHFRYFNDESDYAAMRRLLVKCYAHSGPYVHMTIGDLDWWRYLRDDPALTAVIPLWFAGDELAGFAWPAVGNLEMVSGPGHKAVEVDMLAWGELNCTAPATAEQSAHLRVACSDRDHARKQILQLSGYAPSADFYTLFAYELPADLPEPRLPAGFTLRHVAGDEDLEPRVTVHRAAFHPSRLTIAKHKAVMASPTYRTALDLVVEAPESGFAAYCIVWYDPENQIGLFEPVGCHPDYQRRGLGRAIMFAGLRALQQLGARRGEVLSTRDNSPGAYLYQACGFRAIDRYVSWVKQLEG